MSIPKHLLDAKICNEETCKLSNTIPNDKDLLNMVAHLVVENANMQRKINEAVEYIKKYQYKWYDFNGKEYIEPREFEKDVNPCILLNILLNGSEEDDR